jgi:hypothetical protein
VEEQMHGPYPVWEQLLIFTVMPPCLALLFGVYVRGWAKTVQGGKVSKQTTERQRKEVLAMMLAAWIVGFGAFVVVHFIDPSVIQQR